MIRVSKQKDAEIRNRLDAIEEMFMVSNIVLGEDLLTLTATVRALLFDIYLLQGRLNSEYYDKGEYVKSFEVDIPLDEQTNKAM